MRLIRSYEEKVLPGSACAVSIPAQPHGRAETPLVKLGSCVASGPTGGTPAPAPVIVALRVGVGLVSVGNRP
jgi:hypothetical protein